MGIIRTTKHNKSYAITALNTLTRSSTTQPHHKAYNRSSLFTRTSNNVSLPTIHARVRAYVQAL